MSGGNGARHDSGYRLGALAALCVSIVAAAAHADDAAASAGAAPAPPQEGAQLYAHICQGCHMPRGEGAAGAGHYPPLAHSAALASWQYAALTVLNGRGGMPPFGLAADQALEMRVPRLSDRQVAEIVNFVRSHFGNAYAPEATAAGVASLPHPGT